MREPLSEMRGATNITVIIRKWVGIVLDTTVCRTSLLVRMTALEGRGHHEAYRIPIAR